MTEHARDAEAIFLAALDKTTPQGRAAYVEATCVGDPELLRRVRELLSCHEGSQGLLDAPPPGLGCTVDMPATSEQPGTVIGPYKLLQQIGEGGPELHPRAADYGQHGYHPAQNDVLPAVTNQKMSCSFTDCH